MRFIARLPQESYEQAHLATALRMNASQACEHRTDALHLVKIYMRYAILSWQNTVKQALSKFD